MGQPAYPLAGGKHDGAPQLELVVDVVLTLVRLGYPPIEHPADIARLDLALHVFLYGCAISGSASPPPVADPT